MTNAQSYFKEAIEAKENGNLSSWEESFVESLMQQFGDDPESHETKKALKKMSSNQFNKLRDIASKNS